MLEDSRYPFGCSVSVTLTVIGGRWKPVILFLLLQNTKLRFSELMRMIPKVSQRVLTSQLRELESDGIVIRHVYAEVPPRVEYALSEYGKTLEELLVAMCRWGATHKQCMQQRGGICSSSN